MLALTENDLAETFLAVAQEGGYAAAGRVMYLSPTAVWYRIKKLENELGETLFIGFAGPRRDEEPSAHLTPAGEQLLEELLETEEVMPEPI